MKKLSSYFFAAFVAICFVACASDGNGVGDSCSMEGEWKVKEAEVSSDKLDKTILELTKEKMKGTTYSFTADSVSVNSNGSGGTFKGAYTLDAASNTLSWNAISATNGLAYTETMKVVSCNGSSLKVQKRSPADTTMAAITNATLVLERVK
ncbi:MAG: hypothetical protein GC192_09450 [Bacteroidetes bacterium]|nr:hypothetical protein [Bacteroidota bacterium]